MRLVLFLFTIYLGSCQLSTEPSKYEKMKLCSNMTLFMGEYIYNPSKYNRTIITYWMYIENHSADSIYLKGKIVTFHSKNDWVYKYGFVSGSMPPNSKRQLYIYAHPLEEFNEIEIGEIPKLLYISDMNDTCKIIVSEDYIEYNKKDTFIDSEYKRYPRL